MMGQYLTQIESVNPTSSTKIFLERPRAVKLINVTILTETTLNLKTN